MYPHDRTPRRTSLSKTAITLFVDLFLIAALLLTFAYFHHVRPKSLDGEEINTKPPDDEGTPDFTESGGDEKPEEADVSFVYNDSGDGASGLYTVSLGATSDAVVSSASFRLTYNNVRLTCLLFKPFSSAENAFTTSETDNGDNTSTLTVTFTAEEKENTLPAGVLFTVLFTPNVDLTGLTPYKIETGDVTDDGEVKTVSLSRSDSLTCFGDFRDIYPDTFSVSGIEIDTDTEFKSENVHATWREVYDTTTWNKKVRYVVTDIYVRTADYLKTYVSVDGSKSLTTSTVSDMSSAVGALAAINSDFISCRDSKSTLLVRNGIYYSSKNPDKRYNTDLLVMYADGRMKIVPYDPQNPLVQTYDFSGENVVNIWSFGPTLLNSEGKAMPKEWYNSKVKPNNPRTAVGYYGPGHYCFISVEGRNDREKIPGLRMEELGKLCELLGCRLAYNLDGGDSSVLTWNHNVVSRPSDGGSGRKSTDIIYVVKE